MVFAARHRRRQGPADPGRVRHGRRRRGARGLLHRARAGLAQPRFDAATQGRPLPAWPRRRAGRAPPFAVALRVLGLAVLRVRRLGRRRGPGPADQPDVRRGLRAAVGRHRAALAAVRARSTGRSARSAPCTWCSRGSPAGDPRRASLRLPRWVGYWPAALGLLAFVWLELVYPESTYLSPVRLWFAALPRDRGRRRRGLRRRVVRARRPVRGLLDAGRPPLGLRSHGADGTLVLRSPLGNLDGVPRAPGLVGVVAVLFGSTAFDSFKDSNEWLRFTQSVDGQLDLARPRRPAGVLRRASASPSRPRRWPRASQRGLSPAVRSRTGSRTRWCRSSWATSWRTT